ncbi:MAG: protein kinase [Phycisphaeraceae bacterium]
MPHARTTSFALAPGRKIGRRYVIESTLGSGSEGEVYQVRELGTGILRAAKLYFAHRDPRGQLAVRHAQKLNHLRHCPIVLQYHHSEIMIIARQPVVAMISELCPGRQLEQWVNAHRGKRLHPYQALCLFYELVRGLEAVHAAGEYHSDVHVQNILVQPRGVGFELKLIDFYDWGPPARFKQKQDIVDAVRVFYDCLGGRGHYAKQADELRWIIGGLKRTLILKRFATMTALRRHLEEFAWTKLG